SRFGPRAGLVNLRQTFVRRCQVSVTAVTTRLSRVVWPQTCYSSGLRPSSKLRGGEGVAACDRARAEAGIEPALALLGAPMGKGIGTHVAPRPPRQRIVTDRGRGA